MKRMIVLWLTLVVSFLVVFSVFPVQAEQVLLNGVSATGAGPTLSINSPFRDHTVDIYYTDADTSITAIVVELQGCIIEDISNCRYYTLAEHTFSSAEITAKQAMFHVVDKPVTRVRLNITTLTGEGTGDVIYGVYEGR
jgi:hypothetical protein